jgi:dihydrofolate synthase/folylpolyglutamate synthase
VRSLQDWLQALERLHPRPIELGLERVARVRAALRLQLAMPLFVVAGTNGKGSVCGYLDAMLRAAGFRTGLYTSPHLLRYNERLRIDGVETPDPAWVQAFEQVEHARGDVSLTYFEFGTLAAALLLAEAKLDAAVLEVGLGGRLDAVNVFDADCAVITSIDLDHMQFLGDTREAIGFEKAGILRGGTPAICADPDPPASVLAHAQAIGAPLARLGVDFGYRPGHQQWSYWGARGNRAGLPHPALRGAHQLGNAAAAIAALEALHERLPVDMHAIRNGLVSVSVPGRYQVLPGRPAIVLDVAHNAHAARALAHTLAAHKGHARTLAVFGMLADKDIGAVIAALRDRVHVWYGAGLEGERGIAPQRLAALLAAHDPGKPAHLFDSPASAFAHARSAASDDDRILVVGSFLTVTAVMQALEDESAASGDVRS